MSDYQFVPSGRKMALVPAGLKDAVYLLPLPILQLMVPRLPIGTDPFTPHVRERRVIFIHVPKAAGSSIKMSLYGTVDNGGHRRILEFAAYDAQKTRDFFKFGFVRNPWDRLLSAYSFLMQGGITGRDKQFTKAYLARHADFNIFVLALADPQYRTVVMRYDHFRPQCHWLCMSRGKGHAMDFLGRFETMQADLARLSEILGIELDGGRRILPSVHIPFHEAYTTETWRIVSKIYAEDIQSFGY